jgi:hypothetical protein
MQTFSVQVTYRKGKLFAAYVYLPRQPGDRSKRVEEPVPGLLVDYTADGRPIGIELPSPSAVSVSDVERVLKGLGFSPTPEELAPLRAA